MISLSDRMVRLSFVIALDLKHEVNRTSSSSRNEKYLIFFINVVWCLGASLLTEIRAFDFNKEIKL